MMNVEKHYSVSKVAEIFSVHPMTVKKWIKEGKIRAITTPGGRYRIPESEIRRLMGETPTKEESEK
ncbi:MAG: hypothetical protein DRJ52_02670 [Thermoprotei archaeon]|nr:MAG: hypothetical protein DRJ52_02670 [Thermoprotei archaeon]